MITRLKMTKEWKLIDRYLTFQSMVLGFSSLGRTTCIVTFSRLVFTNSASVDLRIDMRLDFD